MSQGILAQMEAANIHPYSSFSQEDLKKILYELSGIKYVPPKLTKAQRLENCREIEL